MIWEEQIWDLLHDIILKLQNPFLYLFDGGVVDGAVGVTASFSGHVVAVDSEA